MAHHSFPILKAELTLKPGERIPLDGTIARGTSHVNLAPITGESIAVPKAQADEVFAGTIKAGKTGSIVRWCYWTLPAHALS